MPPTFAAAKDHDVGPLRLHEIPDGELVGQVQFRMGAGNDICLARCLELANDGATHHPSVPCNVILCH